MAAAGLGSTLMPAPLLTRLNIGPELAVRPLAEPAFDWHVALIWKPGHYMSHAARPGCGCARRCSPSRSLNCRAQLARSRQAQLKLSASGWNR